MKAGLVLGLFGGTQRYLNDKVTISDIAILQTSSTTVLLYMPEDNFFYNDQRQGEGKLSGSQNCNLLYSYKTDAGQ